MSARQGIILPLVIILIASLSILAAVAIWKLKPNSQTPITKSQTPQASQLSTIDNATSWKTVSGQVSDWKTNKVYKFVFKAPADFKTESQSEKWDFISFNPVILFRANGLSQGPSRFSEFETRASKTPLCSNPLKIIQVDTNRFEVCDLLTLDNQKALFLVNLELSGKTDTDPTCTAYADFYVLYNPELGTTLYFQPSLSVLKDIIKPWDKYVKTTMTFDKNGAPVGCPDNVDSSQVKENLQANIKNIRNGVGLSEQDNQNLQTLYKIISTFKFTQ